MSESLLQLGAFVVGDEQYVVDIMRVREIVQSMKVTQVPHTPAFVEGLVNLRGTLVPLVDMRKRLELPVSPHPGKQKIIICRVGPKLVGLRVDSVVGVIRVPRTQVKPAPELLGTGPNRYFLGVVESGGAVRLLLNVKALLASSEPLPPPGERAQAREQR